MDTARHHLTEAMESRAAELRLRWTDVATRAEISPSQLLRIRQGNAPITPFTAAGLEKALELEPGSIEAKLAGGELTPLGVAPRREPGNEEVDELLERLEALDAERAETLDRLKRELAALRKTRQRRAS